MATFPILSIVTALSQATFPVPEDYQQVCQLYAYIPPQIIGQRSIEGTMPDGQPCHFSQSEEGYIATQGEYEATVQEKYQECLVKFQDILYDQGEAGAEHYRDFLIKMYEHRFQCQYPN